MLPGVAFACLISAVSGPYGATMGSGLDLHTPPGDPLPAVTCADGETLYGIDVSYYQGDIDWPTVASTGVKFALIRVSHSLQFFDPKFEENWEQARAAGIHAGVYQYFEPDEDPIAQADLLLEHMGPLSTGDLPPVIDVESTAGLGPTAIADAVGAWVEHVEAQSGVRPIIYTGRYFWEDNVQSSEFSDYPLWIAHYTAGCPNIPSQWSDWAFHQYTDTGNVTGIGTNTTDLNNFNGSIDDLLALVGEPAGCDPVGADGRTIDNGDACYELHGSAQYWREEAAGHGGSLVWTQTTDLAAASNYAVWRMSFDEAGTYEVEVHIEPAFAQSQAANYRISHAGGEDTVGVDQSVQDGWTSLGTFDFEAQSGHSLELADNTGESGVQLQFDAIRITRSDGGADDDGGDGSDGPQTSGGTGGGPGGDGGDAGEDAGTSGGSGGDESGGERPQSLPGAAGGVPPTACACRAQGPSSWLLLLLLLPACRSRRRGNLRGG